MSQTIKLTAERVRLVHDTNNVTRNSTAYWDKQITYVPRVNEIIIYTDHKQIDEDGVVKDVPGIKIGDGNAYVVDLPFVDEASGRELEGHINDSVVHITNDEREFWNNKLNFDIEGENLIFTRL